MKSRGYAALQAKAPLAPYEFERRELRTDDVAIDILYSGICHSDIHQAREEWGQANFPMVPGHEIAGRVAAIGSSVTKFAVGDLIGVGVYVDSCRDCRACKNGLSQYCAQGMTGTYNALERDGKTLTMGGYSNKFVVNQDYAVKIPASLDLSAVAPLMCAGITLYSPLKHWKVGPGSKVGIIGLGGLGHMGVKYAVALGAEVTVFSHSPKKEGDAKAMGADNFVATNQDKFNAPYLNTFDLILNTVAAEIDINQYLSMLSLDSTLVFIGLSGKPYPIQAGALLGQRRSISGSMIGGTQELQEMLNFSAEHNIVSDVEVIDPDYINIAYERAIASDVKYRFVIDASKF
jgi:uncharacterized zinc-type alcohol dehydrogenase-like protein